MAEFFLHKLKKRVKEKGQKLSITVGGKEGKSKVITSYKYVEEELRECSKKGGVEMADSVETLGVDLTRQTKQLGAKEVRCEVLAHQEKLGLPENYLRTGVRKLLRTVSVPARAWRGQAVCVAPTERFKIEEADGGSSKQKGIDNVFPDLRSRQSTKKRGESKSLKFRLGDTCEDPRELLVLVRRNETSKF